MKLRKDLILIGLLSLVPFALIAFFYGRLPAEIPMQWDFGGEVGYAPKWQLWIVAGLAPMCAVLLPLTAKIDPRRRNYRKFAGSYLVFQVIMQLFVLVLVGMVLVESLRPGTLNVGRFTCAMVSLLFVVLGNMMPKFRPNYFCGFKTPWTLADETVWTRTNRLGGRLFFAAGLIGLLSVAIPNEVAMFIVFFTTIMAAALVPCVMSYVWYRRLHPENE